MRPLGGFWGHLGAPGGVLASPAPEKRPPAAARGSSSSEPPAASTAVPQQSTVAHAASSDAPPLPLLRGRERVEVLRKSALLALLPEAALQRLAASALEKECRKYQSLRPAQSIFVLVFGQLGVQQGGYIPLTTDMPPELIVTAPDLITAAAATAVAIDGAVAGIVSEPGATVGLSHLVGGLVAVPPAFSVMEPTLLLQLPLAGVRAELSQTAKDALGVESRLRILLAMKAAKEAQAPVAAVRELARAMKLQSVPSETRLFSAGEKPEHTLILVHGRVDLYKKKGNKLFSTVDANMPPPLGEMPPPPPPPTRHIAPAPAAAKTDAAKPLKQAFSAVAAEPCLVLSGGGVAAELLSRLLATPQETGLAAEAGTVSPEIASPNVSPSPTRAPQMNIAQALAALQQQQAAAAAADSAGAQGPAAPSTHGPAAPSSQPELI